MMHTFLQIRLLLGLVPLVGAVLWFGAPSGGKHFEKSPAEVRAALVAAHVPTHILGQYVDGSRVSTPDSSTVITALVDDKGAELMRFVTTVTADGTGSQVETEVTEPKGQYAARAAEAMKKQAYTMALMRKLADEHVASAIEGRPFDILAFNPMARGIANAAGYGDTFDQANADAADFARLEKETELELEKARNDVPMGQPIPEETSAGGWGN